MLRNSRQLGSVCQDAEPHKFSLILQKSTTVLRPARAVQFIKNTLRHTKMRESKGPSLSMIQRTSPDERSMYAPKHEDQPKEETERQERCAHGDAWRMAKGVLKLEGNDKATFFSPVEAWCLPAPSVRNPEERPYLW